MNVSNPIDVEIERPSISGGVNSLAEAIRASITSWIGTHDADWLSLVLDGTSCGPSSDSAFSSLATLQFLVAQRQRVELERELTEHYWRSLVEGLETTFAQKGKISSRDFWRFFDSLNTDVSLAKSDAPVVDGQRRLTAFLSSDDDDFFLHLSHRRIKQIWARIRASISADQVIGLTPSAAALRLRDEFIRAVAANDLRLEKLRG